MARCNPMIVFTFLLVISVTDRLNAFSLNGHAAVKRAADAEILQRIQAVGNLNFDMKASAKATLRRRFACFFVFDKEASADLNNNLETAKQYANQLAALASRYAAHANMVVVNAGTELWSTGDRIAFTAKGSQGETMVDILKEFQKYLDKNHKARFGKEYSVGVLISMKPSFVGGGYTEGPPCTTSAASLINYRPFPWSIAGLLVHELGHTMSVVHPYELPTLCEDHPTLTFCAPPGLSAECTCPAGGTPEQCIMTTSFGRAKINGPRYTPCDIEVMNYFSANATCLFQ